MGRDPKELDILCCIPLEDGFDGAERVEFPETSVICVYYWGAYEGIGDACGVLTNYVAEHDIQTEGGFLSIYLEDPPNRGANTANYITQIALSVHDRRQGGVLRDFTQSSSKSPSVSRRALMASAAYSPTLGSQTTMKLVTPR